MTCLPRTELPFGYGDRRERAGVSGVETEEFEEFFGFMHSRLLRYAMRSLDADTANDVAIQSLQTIWTKNLPAPASDAERRELQGLSYRVADGYIRNAIRAQHRRRRLIEAVADHQLTSSREEPDVAEQFVGRGWSDRTVAVLATLGPADREVVGLIVDGFKVGEIAVILDKSPGAISMRLRRAKVAIQQLVERGDPDGTNA